MSDLIIKLRTFLLKHFKSKAMQALIWGLISYEVISYIFFGICTSVLDYVVFSVLTAMGLNSLISNIISSVCAIIFAYFTNSKWVFMSKSNGFAEIMKEFFRFANARLVTLIMSEIILLISEILYGNAYIAKLIAMVLTIILNYMFSKLFIFNNKGKGNKNGRKKNN